MTYFTPDDLAAVRTSLDLPAVAGEAMICERITAMRMACEAGSLDQVRRGLGLPADATAVACAGELCRCLPAGWHHAAVLRMQLVEMWERGRRARVALLRHEAIASARGGSAP